MAKNQIETSWGKISFSWDENGISFISLPDLSLQEVHGESFDLSEEEREIERSLRNYFQGKPVSFSFKTNISGLTAFQQEVLEAVKTIPYGETRSYLWVAKEIGAPKASRAVGGALGKNPIAIIIP